MPQHSPRILVIRATGTVGRHVVRGLGAAGMRVRAMTRYPDGADFPSTVEVMRGDLTVTGRPARTFAAWVSDNAPAFLPRSVAG